MQENGGYKEVFTDQDGTFDAGYIPYQELGKANPFRYRSYYYDTETELYYLKSRYYDPEVGRFITIDDISYLDPESINGLNLYAYCGNNPVMNVDENGTDWWHWVLGIGAVLGMVALTVISFGIAAPLGAMVLMGIGTGIGMGAYNGIQSGENLLGIISNALTGGLIGGALAFAMGLGMLGGAALAGIGAASTTMSVAGLTGTKIFFASILAVSGAYGYSYILDSTYNEKKMTWGGFFSSLAWGAVAGAYLFGLGGIMGFNGWGLNPTLNLIDKALYTGIQILFKIFFQQVRPIGYTGF